MGYAVTSTPYMMWGVKGREITFLGSIAGTTSGTQSNSIGLTLPGGVTLLTSGKQWTVVTSGGATENGFVTLSTSIIFEKPSNFTAGNNRGGAFELIAAF